MTRGGGGGGGAGKEAVQNARRSTDSGLRRIDGRVSNTEISIRVLNFIVPCAKYV